MCKQLFVAALVLLSVPAAAGRHCPMVGGATWYGPGFAGRRTASVERFDPLAMTLASRCLPFGTRLRITDLRTGRSAIGRVNDRGPYTRGNIVDLSAGLARRVGLTGRDVVRLQIVR